MPVLPAPFITPPGTARYSRDVDTTTSGNRPPRRPICRGIHGAGQTQNRRDRRPRSTRSCAPGPDSVPFRRHGAQATSLSGPHRCSHPRHPPTTCVPPFFRMVFGKHQDHRPSLPQGIFIKKSSSEGTPSVALSSTASPRMAPPTAPPVPSNAAATRPYANTGPTPGIRAVAAIPSSRPPATPSAPPSIPPIAAPTPGGSLSDDGTLRILSAEEAGHRRLTWSCVNPARRSATAASRPHDEIESASDYFHTRDYRTSTSQNSLPRE